MERKKLPRREKRNYKSNFPTFSLVLRNLKVEIISKRVGFVRPKNLYKRKIIK
jgi:hypothetical protein